MAREEYLGGVAEITIDDSYLIDGNITTTARITVSCPKKYGDYYYKMVNGVDYINCAGRTTTFDFTGFFILKIRYVQLRIVDYNLNYSRVTPETVGLKESYKVSPEQTNTFTETINLSIPLSDIEKYPPKDGKYTLELIVGATLGADVVQNNSPVCYDVFKDVDRWIMPQFVVSLKPCTPVVEDVMVDCVKENDYYKITVKPTISCVEGEPAQYDVEIYIDDELKTSQSIYFDMIKSLTYIYKIPVNEFKGRYRIKVVCGQSSKEVEIVKVATINLSTEPPSVKVYVDGVLKGET